MYDWSMTLKMIHVYLLCLENISSMQRYSVYAIEVLINYVVLYIVFFILFELIIIKNTITSG